MYRINDKLHNKGGDTELASALHTEASEQEHTSPLSRSRGFSVRHFGTQGPCESRKVKL